MSNNAVFTNKEWKEIKRQPCQIFSRTMGYIRNFASMNAGKKSEHYSRKYFVVPDYQKNEHLRKIENAKFIEQYSF